MTFPILLEHRDAIGQLGRDKVRTSVLSAMGPALVARGADRIIVPVPGSVERERAQEGYERLPNERRRLVDFVDEDGEVLRRVREYLLPLRHQARRWPEDAFVGFAERFLYQAALAAKYRAGVADDSPEVVRGFVPIIDPTTFSGEARFRLGDIVSLVCAYRPASPEYPTFARRAEVARIGRTVWQLVQTAEFNSLVTESPRLGYLKDPCLSLTVLRDKVRNLVASPVTQGLITASRTASDLAGVGEAVESVSRIADWLDSTFMSGFRPPFFSPGASDLTLYRVALEESFPGATAPSGVAMLFETARMGTVSTSWLNVGEEERIAREDEDADGKRMAKWREAVTARERFYR